MAEGAPFAVGLEEASEKLLGAVYKAYAGLAKPRFAPFARNPVFSQVPGWLKEVLNVAHAVAAQAA